MHVSTKSFSLSGMNPTMGCPIKDRHGWKKVQIIRPMSNYAKDVYIYPPPNAPPIPEKIKTNQHCDSLRSTKVQIPLFLCGHNIAISDTLLICPKV